jgi:hypothetical protein
MTLDELREQYSGSAISLEEFAELSAKVTDDPALSQTAKEFLFRKSKLEHLLAESGVEIG